MLQLRVKVCIQWSAVVAFAGPDIISNRMVLAIEFQSMTIRQCDEEGMIDGLLHQLQGSIKVVSMIALDV